VNPEANQREEIPVDAPGSLAFLGERVLVSNHSALRGDPDSWAILDVFAGEPGLALHYPRISPPRLRVGARALRRAARSGVRVRVRVARYLGAGKVPVRGATVRVRGVSGRTNAKGVAVLRFRRGIRPPVDVRVSRRGFTPGRARIERVDTRR
jgi:hypothetical protein